MYGKGGQLYTKNICTPLCMSPYIGHIRLVVDNKNTKETTETYFNKVIVRNTCFVNQQAKHKNM